ncbi:sulfatase-like hydrolase/transferase [bacterium AH-315-E10]|nr:sulfatase-like hydrolase/transferase [bacterium AH-315-E10]
MAQKPNLLFLICDQLQAGCLDVYGGPVETKGWKTLSQEAVLFDRFYCASPLCMPTRPSMMTGRWPHAHGSISFPSPDPDCSKVYNRLQPGNVLLSDYLHENGYHVGCRGVWHINQAEEDQQFNEYPLFQSDGFPYGPFSEDYQKMWKEGDLDSSQPVTTPGDDGNHDWNFSIPIPVKMTAPMEEHPDYEMTDAIIEHIQNTPNGKPFAAWCSIGTPHPPLHIPQEFFDMFKPEDMVKPPGIDEDVATFPEFLKTHLPGRQSVKEFDWPLWQKAIAGYYGYAAFADFCVSRVLDAVKEAGKWDNTVIVATADHGEMIGAHGLYQKGCFYEQSCRVPFAFKPAGCVAGKEMRRMQLGNHVDIVPTILDALGMPPIKEVQGSSLLPIIEDAGHDGATYQFSEFNGHIGGGMYARCVMTERYKYVYNHEDMDLLFDLEADPDELHNLIDDPACADIYRELSAALWEWSRETGDFLEPVD